MAKRRKGARNKPQTEGGDGGPDLSEDDLMLPEETVEELQSEIIVKCLDLWRGYQVNNRNKRLLIDLGVKIFDMLVKYKASQVDINELKSKLKALQLLGIPIADGPIQ